MKILLVLSILFLILFPPTALTQNDLVEQEVRFAKIEVTLSHLNEAVNNLNGQLATIQLTILGLFAAFFIPIVALIMQIKTQLNGLKHDVGTLKEQVNGLEGRVGGLEGKVDELSITTQKHLNQIREALAVQLGIVLEPEDKI